MLRRLSPYIRTYVRTYVFVNTNIHHAHLQMMDKRHHTAAPIASACVHATHALHQCRQVLLIETRSNKNRVARSTVCVCACLCVSMCVSKALCVFVRVCICDYVSTVVCVCVCISVYLSVQHSVYVSVIVCV